MADAGRRDLAGGIVSERTRVELLPARDPEPLRIETGHVQRSGDRVGAVELTTTTKPSIDQLVERIVELEQRLERCTCGS